MFFFFFSSRRRHTRYWRDWSSDVCSSDLGDDQRPAVVAGPVHRVQRGGDPGRDGDVVPLPAQDAPGRERTGLELGVRAHARPGDPRGPRPPRRTGALRVHGHLLELRPGGLRHPDAVGPGLPDAPGGPDRHRGHDPADPREQQGPDADHQGEGGGGRPRPHRGAGEVTGAAAGAVVDEATAVVGRDVASWWRDPLNLCCDTTAAHVEVVVNGVAGYRSLTARGLRPVVVAGHGVGEYAALVAAGALPLDQVVELVHWRAEPLSLSPRPACAGLAAGGGAGGGGGARGRERKRLNSRQPQIS